MGKLMGVILVILSLSGCGKEVVYIDSGTGKEVPPPISSIKRVSLEVVCVGGVQYYTYTSGYHYTMTPRVSLAPSTRKLYGYSC